MTTRAEVIAYARSLAGLSASPECPASAYAYAALIAPGEGERRTAEMVANSGCALTCRAILRRFISHPLLLPPYHSGAAVSELVQIARGAGALRPPTVEPTPGDMVLVGGGVDGGGTEHVWTVLFSVPSPYDEGAWLITGLDGGQRDRGGHEAIALRDHELRGGWDIVSTGARRVRWVLDVEQIVTVFGRAVE